MYIKVSQADNFPKSVYKIEVYVDTRGVDGKVTEVLDHTEYVTEEQVYDKWSTLSVQKEELEDILAMINAIK